MGQLFVNLPNRPKDEEIEVPPYGLLKNGHKYNIGSLEEDVVIGDAEAELPVISSPETASEDEPSPVSPEGGSTGAGSAEQEEGE